MNIFQVFRNFKTLGQLPIAIQTQEQRMDNLWTVVDRLLDRERYQIVLESKINRLEKEIEELKDKLITRSWLLTSPSWGKSSYLTKTVDGYKVTVGGLTVSGKSVKKWQTAIKKYTKNIHMYEGDFIEDFNTDVNNGKGHYGHNIYAEYLKQLFDAYLEETPNEESY